MNKDDSWQDIHDQLTKKRDEAKKKLEQAEIELEKARKKSAGCFAGIGVVQKERR